MEQSAQMTMNVLTTQTLVTMMQFVQTLREPITAPVIMDMKEMVITALVRTLDRSFFPGLVWNDNRFLVNVFVFDYRLFSL